MEWDGKILLILGAAGGVGMAAIEVGKSLGQTTIIACASSPAKRELCKARGSDFAVDYTTRGWHRDVLHPTDQAGVHCVVDPVGGDYMTGCLRCTRPGGCILTLGYAAGIPSIPVEQLLQRNISLVGVWTTVSHYPTEVRISA